ncbi:hypothetical protein AbraIFM66950_001412 [Aspergillus brasiliensis]|nr:hypothetical protein AbraIFM66950_001412 [Aspergillus brasiliensis]
MHPEAENNVQFVDKWPGRKPTDTPTRVPSRIAYPDDNPSLEGKKAWGHEITSAHVAASWTKLLLEPGVEERVVENNNNKRWLNSVGIFARPGGRAPSQIVQDFLNLLRNHAEAQIRNRCTIRNHAILPFAYVFTVPATWSEKAITTLKQAARKAGCHGIDGKNDPLVIPEPEAALTTMIRDPGIPIQERDGVAICDCGGGTLDIGIYVVHRKATGAYMTVGSHTDLQGGSTEVDRGFYTAASESLVKDFDQLKRSETSPTSVLMNRYEKAKRKFQGTIDPDLQELRYIKNGNYFSFKFTSVDMLRLQSPVITRICSVLEDNISRGNRDFGSPMVKVREHPIVILCLQWLTTTQHVYVSGATARSIYLRGALEKIFANSLIKIRYPEFPQNVVAGGAALWGYDRLRLVEHLHHHYGIETPAPPEGAMDVDGNMPPITWVLRKVSLSRVHSYANVI